MKRVPRLPLLRQRHIWLPTGWGWLLIVLFTAAVMLALARNAYPLLAPHAPADGARILVVEGWLEQADLDQAVAAFKRGRYERVLTTGGPIIAWDDAGPWKTYAERAAHYLHSQGLADTPIDAVPAPASQQERTFLSATMLRRWMSRNGVQADAIDLFSAGVHARRSRRVFEMALGPQVRVGVLASRPALYDAERWWASSIGAKAVLGETVGLAWTHCCFWPAAPGTHPEVGDVPPPPIKASAASP